MTTSLALPPAETGLQMHVRIDLITELSVEHNNAVGARFEIVARMSRGRAFPVARANSSEPLEILLDRLRLALETADADGGGTVEILVGSGYLGDADTQIAWTRPGRRTVSPS